MDPKKSRKILAYPAHEFYLAEPISHIRCHLLAAL
jgi:hypothetical protein